MQQQNGLSIVFYPTFPTTRKRLQIHTWPTVYESKAHHRAKATNSLSSSSRQRQRQQRQQQQQQQEVNIKQHEDIQIDDTQREKGSGTESDGFSKVPHEIMMMIMDDLEVTDVISLSMVNRKLRAHTQDNYLWRQILVKQYGESAIQDHNNRLLLLTNSRKGKWKCKHKPVVLNVNWQKVYMYLSTVKVKTKTAHSRGRPGTFYRYRDFDIKDNELSNSRVRQKQLSFNIEMTISNVPPGIYDIIWCMRIDKFPEKPVVHFSTDIWLRHDIYLSSYEREAKYKYSPNLEELAETFDKGWFHFRLPYRIEIAKIEHSDDRRYQVHTGIYCCVEKPAKSSTKGPFSVDYVCLRPHIPYDHCPSSNSDINQLHESGILYNDIYYDYDSVEDVIHNDSNSIEKKYSLGNLKRLRKNKRLSKFLCVD